MQYRRQWLLAGGCSLAWLHIPDAYMRPTCSFKHFQTVTTIDNMEICLGKETGFHSVFNLSLSVASRPTARPPARSLWWVCVRFFIGFIFFLLLLCLPYSRAKGANANKIKVYLSFEMVWNGCLYTQLIIYVWLSRGDMETDFVSLLVFFFACFYLAIWFLFFSFLRKNAM